MSACEPVDLARKVVRVGSLGTRWFIVLLVASDDTDDLVPQIKEASASVLERAFEPSPYAASGRRVVEGQPLMQTSSDMLPGWAHVRCVDAVERHAASYADKNQRDIEALHAAAAGRVPVSNSRPPGAR